MVVAREKCTIVYNITYHLMVIIFYYLLLFIIILILIRSLLLPGSGFSWPYRMGDLCNSFKGAVAHGDYFF